MLHKAGAFQSSESQRPAGGTLEYRRRSRITLLRSHFPYLRKTIHSPLLRALRKNLIVAASVLGRRPRHNAGYAACPSNVYIASSGLESSYAAKTLSPVPVLDRKHFKFASTAPINREAFSLTSHSIFNLCGDEPYLPGTLREISLHIARMRRRVACRLIEGEQIRVSGRNLFSFGKHTVVEGWDPVHSELEYDNENPDNSA